MLPDHLAPCDILNYAPGYQHPPSASGSSQSLKLKAVPRGARAAREITLNLRERGEYGFNFEFPFFSSDVLPMIKNRKQHPGPDWAPLCFVPAHAARAHGGLRGTRLNAHRLTEFGRDFLSVLRTLDLETPLRISRPLPVGPQGRGTRAQGPHQADAGGLGSRSLRASIQVAPQCYRSRRGSDP